MTPAIIRRWVLIVVALVAVSCGSEADDDSSGSSPTDDDAAATTTTNPSTTDPGATDEATIGTASTGTATSDPTTVSTAAEDATASDGAADDDGDAADDAAPDAGDGAGAAEASPAGATASVDEVVADLGLYEGERVAVLGSNPWPIVGELLSLGVTPAVVLGQEGRDGLPDYLAERYGSELADTEVIYDNLFSPNAENLAQVEFDRVLAPDFFEQFISGNEVALGLLGGEEAMVYVDVQFWPGVTRTVIDGAGVDPEPVLAARQAEYEALLAELAASLPYDPTEVEFSTFQWNEDGSIGNGTRDIPMVQVLTALGFVPHPTLNIEEFVDFSAERVLDLDADLVYTQIRGVTFQSFLDDPLWSTSDAARRGNVFQRFQYAQQAGWVETLTLLDQLAAELPTYEPAT
ncbi:MAG: hypothetical protein AAGG08_13180 [Actinomycetota bacterium]